VSTWEDIGSLGELQNAGRLVARVRGREIGVVLDPDGAPRGLRNRCPHHGAPLCLGSVVRRIEGDGGHYAVGDRLVIRCPWHGWEYDLTDGACPEDDTVRVAVYETRVDGDRVLVRV
jgi:nitrite reductase/ring-hydroxylating ferredoxin subunit